MERIKVKNKYYIGQAMFLRNEDYELIVIAKTSKTLIKIAAQLSEPHIEKNKIDRVAMRLAMPEDE